MRYVASKKPVAGARKINGKSVPFKIPVEVPQYDSIQEFVNVAGGDDKALLFINRAAETAAKNGGRAKARNFDEKVEQSTLEEGGENYKAVQDVVRSYTPVSTRGDGISAAKGKEVANSLAAMLGDPNKQTFTAEEIRALLEKSK